MGLQTEFEFTLPKGYVDDDGALHRHGTMRLATARDEIEPLRDARVIDADDPFLTVLVLARVTRLGTLPAVTTDIVEGLFAADMAFLQDLYGIINFGNPDDVEALQASVLPPEPANEPIEAATPDATSGASSDPPVGVDGETTVDGAPAVPAPHDEPTSPPRPRDRHIEEVPRAAGG